MPSQGTMPILMSASGQAFRICSMTFLAVAAAALSRFGLTSVASIDRLMSSAKANSMVMLLHLAPTSP